MQSSQGMVHAFTCKLYEKLQVFFCFLLSLVFIHQVEKSQEDYRIEGRVYKVS